MRKDNPNYKQNLANRKAQRCPAEPHKRILTLKGTSHPQGPSGAGCGEESSRINYWKANSFFVENELLMRGRGNRRNMYYPGTS